MDGLPIYELRIDDSQDAGVTAVALVDNPAFGTSWIAFREIAEEAKFQVQDQEKRIIFGALLIPDKLIPRRADDGTMFNVVFTSETIDKIRQRFMKNGYTSQTNPMHISEMMLDGVYMVETFVKDSERGILPPEQFKDLPDGTWFGGFKVENDEVWNDFIKTGIFTGFSVEGVFQKVKLSNQNNMKDLFKEVSDLFKSYFGEPKKEEEQEPNTEQAFLNATLMDGTAIKIEPALEVGASVQVTTPEGDMPAPDGTHEVSDGTLVTTEGGLITEIKEKMEEEAEFMKQLKFMVETVTGLEARIQTLTAAFESVVAENKELKEQFTKLETLNSEVSVALNKVAEAVEAIPTEEASRKPDVPVVKMSAKERAIAIAKTLSEVKSN